MNIDNMTIREARVSDTETLARLIRDSFRNVAERFALTKENCPKHPSNYTDEWVKNDFDRGVLYYILESDKVPLGCVAIEKADAGLCYMERLAVLPEKRGNGLGKMLVDHFFDSARAMERKHVSIGIIAEQTDLSEWYEKIGFVPGETKVFPHLPFTVGFMSYEL